MAELSYSSLACFASLSTNDEYRKATDNPVVLDIGNPASFIKFLSQFVRFFETHFNPPGADYSRRASANTY